MSEIEPLSILATANEREVFKQEGLEFDEQLLKSIYQEYLTRPKDNPWKSGWLGFLRWSLQKTIR